MQGHAWTVYQHVRDLMRPPQPPVARPFEMEVADARFRAIRLSGWLAERQGAEGVVIILHGLAGSAESSYACRAAAAAAAAGMSSLRLNLRGADRRGEDFFHAGLTSDLHAVLAHPDLARYRHVVMLGFSLGGHLALRLASERPQRLHAVAAICPPLDLARAADAFDAPSCAVYRHYILRGLRQVYRAVAARRDLPVSVERVERARTIRMWDELTVVPRYGFHGAEHYYRSMSVAPRLAGMTVPTLLVVASADPVVDPASSRAVLASCSDAIRVHWLDRGGHLGFPADLHLGVPGPFGLEYQAVSWLARQLRRAGD